MDNGEVVPTVLTPTYSGGVENVPLSNQDLLRITSQESSTIYGPTLFALKYRVLPCTMMEDMGSDPGDYNDLFIHGMNGIFSNVNRGRQWCGKKKHGGMFHSTSVVNFLVNEYKINADAFLYDSSYDTFAKHSLMSKLYIDLGTYLSVQFSNGLASSANVDNPSDLQPDREDKTFNCFALVQVFHVPQTAARAHILLEQLSKFKLFPVTEATLQMVCHSEQRGFFTSSIRMKKPHIADLRLHYGEEFLDIHEDLMETLQEKDSTGITFLHGPPGTGKTYYLRYLINEIKDKSLIYVPPDMVKEMTKPGFIPFLMQRPNSILIVEDAENIIRDRQQDNYLPNQAVSNLLNLSDGLLGDAMHQQIICTFNCDVRGIDPALLREGRLVVEHKFDKLSVENARRICVEFGIPGNGEDIHESTTLAEIYTRKNAAVGTTMNGDENDATTVKTKRQQRKKKQQPDPFIGFYS